MSAFTFPPPPVSDVAEALRGEVRAFLADALKERTALQTSATWLSSRCGPIGRLRISLWMASLIGNAPGAKPSSA